MKNPIYRKLAPTPPAPVNRVQPPGHAQLVDLRKILRTRLATIIDAQGEKHEAAALIKSIHHAGGTPLHSAAQPAAAPALRQVETATPAPAAPKRPTMDDGTAVTQGIQDNLDSDQLASTIRGVHKAGGYRIQPGRNQR